MTELVKKPIPKKIIWIGSDPEICDILIIK